MKIKGKFLIIVLILFLSLICTISALEITINSPINNSVFFMKPSDFGIFIEANASTDENATCKVMPWDVNLSTLPSENHFNNISITNENLTDYEMSFICNDTNNSVFEKSVFFSINYSCTSNLTNSSWSNWEYYECRANNMGNQSRYKTQYDSENCGTVTNQTFYEYREMPCDYCSENITGPFYNNWSECDDYGIRHRTGYYTDLNFLVCCNVTKLPDDCEIKNKYKNFIENEDCNLSLNLFVNSPSKDIYESRRIKFDINSTLRLEFLEFIDYFENNKWNKLCTDCKTYTGNLVFNDGKHNLTIRARNDGKEAFSLVSFLVDTKNPNINSMTPRGNKLTNGSDFSVKYTEENCKSIVLEVFGFGGIGNKTMSREPCISGRSVIENFSLNLTDFNNQEISYQFAVYDVTDKKTRSKFIKVKVDTTAPIINSLNYSKDGNYVNIKLNITEKNFDKAIYTDPKYPNSRILCSSLDKYGICNKKIRFYGNPINIIVLDKAGNSVEKEISV